MLASLSISNTLIDFQAIFPQKYEYWNAIRLIGRFQFEHVAKFFCLEMIFQSIF